MQQHRQDTGWIRRFSRDESGALRAGDYILMVTILCVGAVAGLATVRDAAVQDFGDLAVAMESLDQSYTISMVFGTMDGGSTTVSYGYQDELPQTQGIGDPPGQGPHCIRLCTDFATAEN